jgi:hypothetical protein
VEAWVATTHVGGLAAELSRRADRVQFSMLGPICAWRGQVELNLGSNQQRAILALLLIRANYLVCVDDLIELLWEEKPPRSAVNVIHKHIGAIRRLLEPDLAARAAGRWLTRNGTAYRLAVDADTSDLISFRRMVRDAASAHAADRPADALELLTEALGLRRGACGEGLDLYAEPAVTSRPWTRSTLLPSARPLMPPWPAPSRSGSSRCSGSSRPVSRWTNRFRRA